MKDLVQLAQGAAIIFIGTLLGQFLGFLAELLIIRSLNPQTLGTLGLAYAIVATGGSIALLGMPAGITRILSANKSEQNTGTLTAGLLMATASCAALAIALYLSREWIQATTGDAAVTQYLLYLLPYLLVLPLSRVSFSGLRAHHRSLESMLSKWVLAPTLGIGLLLAFSVSSYPNTTGIVFYWISLPLLTAVFSTVFLISKTDFRFSLPKFQEFTELWSFSWPLAVSVSLTMFLTRIDILMLGIFVDSGLVGQYRSVQPLRQVTTLFAGAFGFLFMPIATEYYESGDISKLTTLYQSSTKWITSLTLPFVLVLVVFPESVIQVLFGAQYTRAAPVLSILIGGLFFRAIVGLDTDLIKAIDRTKIELVSAILGLFVNIAANILLIPRIGIEGAAVATVLGFIIYNLVEIAFIYVEVGTHPFIYRNLTPLFVTATTIIGVRLILSPSRLGFFELAAFGVFCGLHHVISLTVTNSFTENDIILIEGIESRLSVDLSWLKTFIRWRG